jgi:glycosyltransferase involved in cell wall biosynthesis
MLVYDDGRSLTTNGTFQLMLSAFAPYFSRIDLCAAVLKTRHEKGRERVPTESISVVALPAFRDGFELLKQTPSLLLSAVRIFAAIGPRWDIVWIVDCEPSQQLLFWLCTLFRKPAVVYMRGREDTIEPVRRRRFPLNLLARMYFAFQREALPLLARHAHLMVTGEELYAMYGSKAIRAHRYVSSLTTARDIEPDLLDTRERSGSGEIKLLSVGRIAPVKGLHVLLDALAHVRRCCPPLEVRLRIVGHNAVPEYEAQLRSQVVLHNLEDWVSFVPPKRAGEELMAEYRSADIFVCPSIHEGTPKTIPEAMTKGLPIIATRVGGIPELVRDGYSGVLVPPGDPIALADALIRVSSDPRLRRALGNGSIERARALTLELQARRAAEFLTATCYRTAY